MHQKSLRLSTILDYSGDPRTAGDRALELERAGIDLVWVAEAYTFDAVSLLGFLAARTERVELGSGILNVYSRTPSLLAMTAAGLDALSGGRFVLGLGASGPQVVEGWHGVPYDRQLGRTRETVEICRKVWARREPLAHHGSVYTLPYRGEQATGLGRPLRLINRPIRPRIPVWVAALGEKNVALAAEIGDGWLPVMFVPEKAKEVFGPALTEGTARRDPGLPPLEIAAGGLLAITDDPDEAIRLRDRARPQLALYIGGMGAPGRNFYNALIARYGWEAAAKQIQELYLSGRKAEAEAAVPVDLLEQVTLVGPEGHLKDRISAYREAGVTVLNVSAAGSDPVGDIARLKQLAS